MPRGSVRVQSTEEMFVENSTKPVPVDEYDTTNALVKHVAFLTPTNEHVLVLINTAPSAQRVEIREGGRAVTIELDVQSIVTALWSQKWGRTVERIEFYKMLFFLKYWMWVKGNNLFYGKIMLNVNSSS